MNEYLTTLADCKDNARPLAASYTAPHVVACMESDYARFRYFNGIEWHSVYMPPAIKSVIPHLRDSNRYCVAGDTLVFLRDHETVGCVKLLSDFDVRVSYADVPKGVFRPRISATNDPETVLLMSDEIDRMISKVKIASDGQLEVSPWTTVNSDKYRFQFLDNAGIVYTIDGYRCALSTDGTSCSKFGVSPEGACGDTIFVPSTNWTSHSQRSLRLSAFRSERERDLTCSFLERCFANTYKTAINNIRITSELFLL